ncbi:GNAT family N-acetyltransferase [Microbacteriaceae bacterium 4G12]
MIIVEEWRRDMEQYQIQKALSTEIPIELLLLADPHHDHITSYVQRGQLFTAKQEEQIIGAYVLLETRPKTMEIVNIAVISEHQGKGIGKQLIAHALEVAKHSGMHTVEIGTGNSSIDQLALYQKCGFRIVGIDHDYFVKYYEEPIIENGIVCRDMIRLALDLY